MLKGFIIWTMTLSICGEEVVNVGLFTQAAECLDMKKVVTESVLKSFSTDSVYGISTDRWGIGGGAIIRASDYTFECNVIIIN